MLRSRLMWMILILISLCCSWNSLAQSCDNVGLVGNGPSLGFSDCGIIILSVNDGQLFVPTNQQEDLSIGNLILFSFDLVDSSSCTDQLSTIQINCLQNLSSETNCAADFITYPDDLLFNRTYSFDPLSVDSSLTYTWSFGDGTTSILPTAIHTYQQNGEYLVCLTTSDGKDCQDIKCDSLSVMTPLFNNCDFKIESQNNANAYQVEVFNPSDFGPYHPQQVEWYQYETGTILGNQPILEYVLTDNDPLFINVCVDIIATNEEETNCSATICHILFNKMLLGGNTADSTCQALFGYLPTTQSGAVEFQNLSPATAIATSWDFGDGETSENTADSFIHNYSSPGLYNVCLTIETLDACITEFCLPVFTVGGTNICQYNDCVFPGDTDKDGLVNIFDVLPIGLGFKEEGVQRPNASIQPIFQAAFDWFFSIFQDADTKHVDCDGNGIIDEADFIAIDQNYQPIEKNQELPKNEALPPVHLAFPKDTMEIANAGGNTIEIPLTLTLGSEDLPLKDLQGIALSIGYNPNNIQKINNELSTTSFLGNPEELLQKDKLIATAKQYDIAISQKGKRGVDGFGEVADFVVIVDLIDARHKNVDLSINDLKVINSKGELIPVSVPTDSIHLTILSIENRPLTTSIEETLLQQNISIAPNPITHNFQLALDMALDFQNGQLSIYTALGEQVAQQEIIQAVSTIDVASFAPGVYWVHVQLAAGQLSQQIVVLE